ncbi:PQQ-binding-like beta-propeller repeat protein [Sporosalibacterium faouarense]|uniref:outer membrane protein assembly factor BamB family protein n=1 Tax=Sporosalibacterium faouarense TaxID=516123 RepID=UPI00192B4037|nr:PQQ-binding-like beta-propeller repeat protein [Sporosalibacterium faouarense]
MKKKFLKTFILCTVLILLTNCSQKKNEQEVDGKLDKEVQQADVESQKKENEKEIKRENDNEKENKKKNQNKYGNIVKKEFDNLYIVDDISGEQDIYPVIPDIEVLRRNIGGTTVWDIINYESDDFILTKDKNNNLYLSKTTVAFEKDDTADSIDITSYIADMNVNVTNIDLEVLNISYESDWLIFKVRDENNEVTLVSNWYGEKHLFTRSLEDEPIKEYNITNVAVIPSNDYLSDRDDYYEIYTYTKEDNNYFLIWDYNWNRVAEYKLPKEIKEVRRIYTSYDLKDSSFYERKKDKIYIQALTTLGDYTVSYEIDLSDDSIKRYDTVRYLKEIMDIEWTFKGNVENLVPAGRVGDVVLIYGHDRYYSGYHNDEYLYGVDMKTGNEIWSVYGGYMGVDYSLSSDKKYIITAVPLDKKIQCIEIETGKIIWEKILNNAYNRGSIKITSIQDEFIIECADIPRKNNNRIILGVDQKTGIILWEKKTDEKDFDVYDSKTGKEVFTIDIPRRGELTYETGEMFGIDHIIGDPIYWSNNNWNNKQWIGFEDGFRLIDLETGVVLQYIRDEASTLVLLNEEYSILRTLNEDSYGDKRGHYHKNRDKTEFSLYSNLENKVLWNKDEVFLCATIDDDKLYYITDNKIKSVELATGNTLWENHFPNNLDDLINIKPLIINDELFVVYKSIIYSFDIESGELLYQVGDYFTQYAWSWGVINNYHLTMYRDGNYLLIGKRRGMMDLIILD